AGRSVRTATFALRGRSGPGMLLALWLFYGHNEVAPHTGVALDVLVGLPPRGWAPRGGSLSVALARVLRGGRALGHVLLPGPVRRRAWRRQGGRSPARPAPMPPARGPR